MQLTKQTLKSIYPPDLRWGWKKRRGYVPNGSIGKYSIRIYSWCKQYLQPTRRDAQRHCTSNPDLIRHDRIKVLCQSDVTITPEGRLSEDLRHLVFMAVGPQEETRHRNRLRNIMSYDNYLVDSALLASIRGMVDVTEAFWEGYQKMGICFLDRDHTCFSTYRFRQTGDDLRTCFFCGKSYRRHEYEVPQPSLKMSKWLPLE